MYSSFYRADWLKYNQNIQYLKNNNDYKYNNNFLRKFSNIVNYFDVFDVQKVHSPLRR